MPPFPFPAGAIDLGSNGLRLLAVEVEAPDRFTELPSLRVPVRLGRDVFSSGRIGPAAMAEALATLKGFRERLDSLRVERYRAVATSAVRESRNGRTLRSRALKEDRADVIVPAALHGLGENDRDLLGTAAILHDVDAYISYSKHPKHSFSLISQSEIGGFSPREMFLIALIARHHRKSEPTVKHAAFALLPEEDRQRVRKLAAILRMADALDREHLQRAHSVRVEVGTDAITLFVTGEGLDGSEKSTQIHLVQQWLIGLGCKVFFWEWNSSSMVQGATRRGKKKQLLTPTTFSLIHATDFADRYMRQILPMLKGGYIVLCDRYIYTLMARDLLRGAEQEWLDSLYSMALVPDHVFVLQTSIRNQIERKLSFDYQLDYWESGMDLGLSPDWFDSYHGK